MPNCPFCDPDHSLNYDPTSLLDHLLVIKEDTGHIHVHGPIDNKKFMCELITAIARESGFEIEIED